MSKDLKRSITSYVNENQHALFKLHAENSGKTVSRLVQELVVALVENRLKLTPKEPELFNALYNINQ